MSSYEELRKEFDRKVEELRENCPHIESTWSIEMIDLRYSGYEMRLCNLCDKELEHRPIDIKTVHENMRKQLKEQEEKLKEIIKKREK